jgi:hypothetical protein
MIIKPPKFTGAKRLEFWAEPDESVSLEARGPILIYELDPLFNGEKRPWQIISEGAVELPDNWKYAVVEYADGVRMETHVLDCSLPISAENLSHSNAYSSPNFDIDTSINKAGLDSLKGGGGLAAGDKIYYFNGATVTLDASCAFLFASAGEKSSGAATDGQRYGSITASAGVTITFDGNATATNSGIKASPASAPGTAGESKNISTSFPGTSGSHIVFTNAGGALATGQRWILNLVYGSKNFQYCDFQYSYGYAMTCGMASAASNASKHYVNYCTTTQLGTTGGLLGCASTGQNNIPLDARFNTMNVAANAQTAMVFLGTLAQTTGFYIDTSGSSMTGTPGGGVLAFVMGNQSYLAQMKTGYDDIRPTVVVPANLTFTDLQDGTVKITVSNIASVASTDLLVIFDASNNKRMTISRARYEASLDRKAANMGIIAGVPLSAMTGWYAQYTSDYNTFSASSTAASTVTPTFLPAIGNVRAVNYGQGAAEFTGDLSNLVATDGAYVTLENSRNNDNGTVAADIATGKSVKIRNTTINGSNDKVLTLAEEASRNTDPGVSHVDVDAVASYKHLNVTKTPTLSLSAEKTAYEESRNENISGVIASDLKDGESVKIRNITITGNNNKVYSQAEYEADNDPASLTPAKLTASAGNVKIRGTTYSPGTAVTAADAAELVDAAYNTGVDDGEANNSFDGTDQDIEHTKTLTLHGVEIPGKLVQKDLTFAQEITRNTALAANYLKGEVFKQLGEDVPGEFDEAARNEIPDLSLIPTPASGGPAAWLMRNVSRVGTWNLTTWEAARNTALKALYKLGEVFLNKGVSETGEQVIKDLTFEEEAVRNTSPGTSNVTGGVTWKYLGATLTGVSDKIYSAAEYLVREALRNTDMLAENVKALLVYITRGETRTGTHSGGGGEVPVPAKVTGLGARAESPTEISLLWVMVPWATSYKVYRDDVLIASGITDVEYVDETAAAETEYSYQVAATNTDSGDGPKSNALTISTPAVVPDAFKAQLATDLDTFFEIQEFAEEITLIPSGQAGYKIKAIFDETFQAVNPNTDEDILSVNPVIHIREKDLTAALGPADRFKIRGELFSVVTNEPDGVGIIKLSLHQV